MPSVIEFFDETGEIIVARFPPPPQESAAITLGSQLVVQESQLGFFFRDGQALDGFAPGRHTLKTQNLPLLTKLVGLPFGGKSPFRAYVVFVSTKAFTNIGWGTPTPVLFRDTDFRMVSLRAHGSYSLRVIKPRLFLNTMVGTRGLHTTFALQEFFRTVIVGRLNEVLGSEMKSILDLPARYGSIRASVKKAVFAEFDQYGLELVDLIVEAITVPPEVQEMLNRATGVAAQDAEKYRAIAAADALRDVARNPSSGGVAGAGLGVGLGVGLARELIDTARPAPPAPPAPAAASSGSSDVASRLTRLKQLREGNLISDEDFEQQKRRILSEL